MTTILERTIQTPYPDIDSWVYTTCLTISQRSLDSYELRISSVLADTVNGPIKEYGPLRFRAYTLAELVRLSARDIGSWDHNIAQYVRDIVYDAEDIVDEQWRVARKATQDAEIYRVAMLQRAKVS